MYENTIILLSGANYFHFNTKSTAGAPITLAGTPSLAASVNGGAGVASGLTLTVDDDSITGFHQVAFDVDDATLALSDGDVVEVYIAAGTVDSISVVGTVIARLSISDGSLLSQTETDIQAAAAAALTAYDPPTHAELVSEVDDVQTDIAALDVVVDRVEADTQDIQTRIPAALVGGRIDADVGNVTDAELAALISDLAEAGRLDLLIDAIKAKTDSLTFTNAGEVDANVQSINDAAVIGDGNATPWDGA